MLVVQLKVMLKIKNDKQKLKININVKELPKGCGEIGR